MNWLMESNKTKQTNRWIDVEKERERERETETKKKNTNQQPDRIHLL
jgi:hypothetical protein